MPTFKFLGNSDEVNTCDCCGRKNLKSTVAISIDDRDPVFYGVVCAARALSVDGKEVRKESKRADDEKRKAIEAIKDAARRAENDLWFDFLRKHGKGTEVIYQIQSLGGYAKAQELYKAVAT